MDLAARGTRSGVSGARDAEVHRRSAGRGDRSAPQGGSWLFGREKLGAPVRSGLWAHHRGGRGGQGPGAAGAGG